MEYDPLHLGILESDIAGSVAQVLGKDGEELARLQQEINQEEALATQRAIRQQVQATRKLIRVSGTLPKPAVPVGQWTAAAPKEPTYDETDWWHGAACRGKDPELFHSNSGKFRRSQIEQAKAICEVCPVVDFCLKDALRTGDSYSIAGATTPDERRAIRAKKIKIV